MTCIHDQLRVTTKWPDGLTRFAVDVAMYPEIYARFGRDIPRFELFDDRLTTGHHGRLSGRTLGDLACIDGTGISGVPPAPHAARDDEMAGPICYGRCLGVTGVTGYGWTGVTGGWD